MNNNVSPADKLRDNTYELDNTDFEINMSNVVLESFNYNYGGIEDIELSEDAYVTGVDGQPLDQYVIIDRDAYNEILTDLEVTPTSKQLLLNLRDAINSLLGNQYD